MLLKKQLIILVLLFYGRVLFGFQIPIDSIQKPHRLILTQGVISATKGHLPFWMVSNNSGRFSDNQSSSAYTSILFTKSAEAKKNVDYFYRIEAQSVIGRNTNKNSFIQAYGGISLRWVNIHIGLKEEVFGLNDSTLSVGNLVYGSNARPIPKIVLSTNGWVNAPILPQLFSFKAYLAHGWFEKNRYQSSAFLHQKNVYVRSKFIKNRLNIDFGINHNVQWGGHNYSNDSYQPVGLRNYAKIFIGWSGGSDALETDRKNALGNHLGSYDLSGSYKFKNWTLSNYWQFLWEDSSGLTPFNWRDGLMGISIKSNIQESPINTINIEIIRTNDQGALKLDEDGNQFVEPDDFFNNSVYGSGWSYNNRVIGNPIFLINKDPASERNIIDNMINGFSLGVAGQINNLKYQTSYRWFKNQGTYTDRLSEPYTLSSISSKIELKYSKSSFGFILMYEWGKERPEGNTGLQLSYSRQFSF